MIVKQFRTGGDRNFGYLIADEESKQAVIIDPSYSPDMLVDYAEENNLTIRYIFITHDHYDHTNGNQAIYKRTGIKPLLYGSQEEQSGKKISDNTELPLGSLTVKIIHTPGHTHECMCILVGDALFTGDTLFVGKIGGTDFGKAAKVEYESLHNKLLVLPDHIRVFPGHDYGTDPESTIGHERKTNPFLIQPDFNSFVELKRNWGAYKAKHGIK